MRGCFCINGRDGDGGDEGHVADGLGVALGQDADGGEVVFLKPVGQVAEPPAQDHHIGGGERERQFLRRLVLIVLSIRVWLQRVLNQLAGVEGPATVFRQVELDGGAVSAGRGVTGVIFGEHKR